MADDSKSTQMTPAEAGAAMMLAASPEWSVLAEYWKRRLRACENDLGILSTDTAPGLIARAQGQRIELNTLLSLGERAEKVLDGARNRR
jgi:hypothetical protein